ncbi:hypothetical protein ACFX13_034514 [Malus domestica]
MSGGGSSESWRENKVEFGGNTRNPPGRKRREEAGPFQVLTGGDSLLAVTIQKWRQLERIPLKPDWSSGSDGLG